MSSSKKILFWRQGKAGEEDLPWPADFVDTTISAEKRRSIAAILMEGNVINSYRGMAKCRLCREMLGSQDKSGHGFIWPSRAEHYVLKHDLWIPEFDEMLSLAKDD